MRSWLLVLPIACAVVGCYAQPVDLGSDGGATSSSGGVSGTWTGYIENFTFPDGSDTMTLVVHAESNDSITGTLTFGTRAAPPPPTDPNVGYPPGAEPNPLTPASIEGFHYTLVGGKLTGTRVQFGVSTLELWKAWCALQTPEPPPAGSTGEPWGCNPRSFGGPGESSPPVCVGGQSSGQVDCGKAAICTSDVCDCTMTACTVDRPMPDLTFDMQWNGGRLDGSTSTNVYIETVMFSTTPQVDGRNVHFTR